jgi:VWFA-related protein
MRLIPALLLAVSAWAQQSLPGVNQPEVTSHEATVTFSSKVNLVSVPVVVRDADGKPIGTLKQEDFQLFDKGKLQVITKFTIEKTESLLTVTGVAARTQETAPGATITAPAKALFPERYVAYLFDDIHLNRGDLLNARVAVNKHLDESLEPNTRAAIFTTSGKLVTDFTSDVAKLHAAVNRILPWESGLDPQTDCPPVSYYVADLLTNKLLYFSGYLFTDAQLLATAQGGQADTALLSVINEAAECSGGGSNSQEQALQAVRTARVAVRQSLAYGDRDTTFSLKAVKEIVRRMQAMPGSRTIVLASPGFLLTVDHRQEEYDVLDYALRMNVAVNTIDMRGLYTPPGFAAESKPPAGALGAFIVSTEGQAAFQSADVLAELADGTGGTFFHDDNGLKEGLNRIAARPEYIYVLGFSPQNLKYDGSFHDLKVKLPGARKVSLQVRKGYWAPRHAEDSAEEVRDEIRDAVFSREELDAFAFDVQTEYFRSNLNDKVELTVTDHLDAGSMRFSKAGDRNNDTVTVVTGVFDDNGNYVSGIQRVLELHLRDATLEKLGRSGLAVKETFKVAPGRYVVRTVVRDGEGKTIAARNRGVEIP